MSTMTDHQVESVPEESVTSGAETVDVLGMGPRKKAGGAGSDVVASVAELAAEQVRAGGMQLLGEGGLLQQLTKHLLQDALEAGMDEHLRSLGLGSVGVRVGSDGSGLQCSGAGQGCFGGWLVAVMG